ncbi:E3 SUMO-protein ligase ZBED1-like [Argopecten irradians]|uniref:E3 SUMO-protein ligase ZBED1-like n=1 Tax=Argopecten irradians TaxID=31199 RepID=UPI0037161B72
MEEASSVNLRDAAASYRSAVWKHFGFRTKDSMAATCRICYTDVPYKHGNTSNMNTHLVRKHNIGNVRTAQVPVGQVPTVSSSTAQKNHNKARQRYRRYFLKSNPIITVNPRQLHRQSGVFIAVDMRPYSVVENAGFRYLLNALEPRYAIPSKTHIADIVIPALYKKVRERVEAEIKMADSIAITTDSWSSRATEKLKAAQTAVFTPHIGCFAHTLNLATGRGLAVRELDRLLGRVRRIVSYFHRSTSAAAVL